MRYLKFHICDGEAGLNQYKKYLAKRDDGFCVGVRDTEANIFRGIGSEATDGLKGGEIVGPSSTLIIDNGGFLCLAFLCGTIHLMKQRKGL